MGLMDIFKPHKTSIKTENISLQRCISGINKWNLDKKEDTVFLSASRICTLCCVYNRRIYSVFGNDKRFPRLLDMPSFLLNSRCPECNGYLGYTVYFSYIENKKDLRRDISYSNRPFIDDSDEDVLQFRKEAQEKRIESKLEENEFKWLSENLPEISPKSLSGYRRMKHSNSKNYQNLIKKAKEKGYEIKS